ncbi:MAG: 2-amino-4-hydroxy-6-hydroxymethyldihydropteridine diphosphokinase [Sphingomonadales bacterium]
MVEVFIALGANLPSKRFGPPRDTLEAAIAEIERGGVTVTSRSRWFESAPVPVSDQPWFVNGVIGGKTTLDADGVMALLHHIESAFGRARRERWEARVVDLDLLACGSDVRSDGALLLPHPRMHQRRFVLAPMADIAPEWRHPVLDRTVRDLLRALPDGEIVRPLGSGPKGG